MLPSRIIARRATKLIPSTSVARLVQTARRSIATVAAQDSASPAISRYTPPTLGVNPAYDEALKVISADRTARLERLKEVEAEIARAIKATNSPTQAEQLSVLRKLKFDLQVKAELNNPEVQWNFKHGYVDMSHPVYRYMQQKHFLRKPFLTLMQRITQMYVIPDLLPPSAVPSVDVTLDFGSDIGVIEPGVFVKPANSIRPPILKVANFHEDTRLYTVLMVDPDLPDPERMTYQQHCHWLITNVALSATSPIVTNGDVALPYIPPHPQRGTKYHRYTVMVLEQPRGGKQSVHVDATERAGFDAAAFRERHGLVPKGVSFFRGVWDEDVTRIYNEILGTREPIFGKPPKIDPYIMETGRKRKKYLTV